MAAARLSGTGCRGGRGGAGQLGATQAGGSGGCSVTVFLQPLHPSPLLCPTLSSPRFCWVGMLPGLLPFCSQPTLASTQPVPLGTPPGLSCWSRDGGTEPLAWLHQHLFPLAVPVAPGRSPACKKHLGRAKLERDCATSIVVSLTPAVGDPTAMVHRQMTGMSLICASLGFGLDYSPGIRWEGDVAMGLFPCILLCWRLASENAMPAVRYRNHKYYCPTRS